MNIGIVTTWFERGAAYVSKAYVKTLSKQHKVFIYARGGEKFAKGDPNWDSSNVHWGNKYTGRIPSYVNWSDFYSWFTENQLQVIIFNEQISWDIILKCRAKLNIPIGAYIDYYKKNTVELFDLYDFLLCNTKRHYSIFQWHKNAIYIPWGTDIELLQPSKNDKLFEEDITFFHSCGMSPHRKGTDILVEAFKLVPGDSKLIIHSQAKGVITGALKNAIQDNTRITLIEEEISLPGLYYLGDIYVYPSRLDGIGLTIAEALACGLPVIATNEQPMNEFIQDDINGKLVKVSNYKKRYDHYYWPEAECDVPMLTAAMVSYINNLDQLTIHSNNARKSAEMFFNWDKNSFVLHEFLNTVKKKERNPSFRIILKTIFQEYTLYNYPPPYLVKLFKALGLTGVFDFIRRTFHRI